MKKVKIRYIKGQEFSQIYVNGVIGGISPKGEIVMNFFRDTTGLPDFQIFELGADGKLTNEIKEDRIPKEDSENFGMDRILSAGVILTHQTAVDIHKWLGDHIANINTKAEKK